MAFEFKLPADRSRLKEQNDPDVKGLAHAYHPTKGWRTYRLSGWFPGFKGAPRKKRERKFRFRGKGHGNG